MITPKQLKRLRLLNDLTQMDVAKAVKVAQPTYQRWEAGDQSIPAAKVMLLAKILSTTPGIIRGEADKTLDENDNVYWGSVRIDFRGRGESLVVPISNSQFKSVYCQMQDDVDFLVLWTVDNRYVAVRRDAIDDIYAESRERLGSDDNFLRNETLPLLPDILIPDDPQEDWEIIETLADRMSTEGFDSARASRIEAHIGYVDDIDVQSERTQKYFTLATDVVWQLSSGTQRRHRPEDNERLHSAFWSLANGGAEPDHLANSEPVIRLDVQSDARSTTAIINKRAIDYVYFPTHKFELGLVDSCEEDVDGAGVNNPSEPFRERRKNWAARSAIAAMLPGEQTETRA